MSNRLFSNPKYWSAFREIQVLHNVDELFEREELSAAPDAGWPDCFNSGVFVFRPSEETYQSLLQFAVSQGSFDGKLTRNEISFQTQLQLWFLHFQYHYC